MTGKTITKTTTTITTTKHYETEANVESKSNSNDVAHNNKLDPTLDGNVLSTSPSPTMKMLAYEGDGGGGGGGPKLVDFEIFYDVPSAVFTGGDTITGKLRIALRDSMKMRLIKLQFKGRASVAWSENKSAKDASTGAKQSSSAEQVFFNKEIVLLERRPGQEVPAEFVLPAGIHVLPFIFPLPKNLPTSYEGDRGSIRYYCRAVIVKPWKHDHMTKRAFTVLSSRSAVAVDPTSMKPITVSERTTVKSLCCFTGFVSWEISLPKEIYSPGEMITVAAKISNLSRRQIPKAIVSLVQLATYRTTNAKGDTDKTVKSTRVVAERILEKPLHDGKIHWNQEPMFRVPSTCPTLVDDTLSILRVEYELRVELVMSGGRSTDSLFGRLPVTIVMAKSTKYVDDVLGNANIREIDENQYVKGPSEFTPMYPVVE